MPFQNKQNISVMEKPGRILRLLERAGIWNKCKTKVKKLLQPGSHWHRKQTHKWTLCPVSPLPPPLSPITSWNLSNLNDSHSNHHLQAGGINNVKKFAHYFGKMSFCIPRSKMYALPRPSLHRESLLSGRKQAAAARGWVLLPSVFRGDSCLPICVWR